MASVIVLIAIALLNKAITGYREEEFCISEIFKPLCHQEEILIISEAHFGRPKVGRCLKDEEGLNDANLKDGRHIGCYDDVKSILASKCSGKSNCEVRIAELTAPKSCYNYLKSYLTVTYRCIKVAQNYQGCTIKLIGSTPQYLPLGKLSQAYSCGRNGNPWIVETLKGQQILASLDDFSVTTESIGNKSSKLTNNCKVKLGHLAETANNINTSICFFGENTPTDRFTHLSKGNVVEVTRTDKEFHFIVALTLEATGCSDLIPPADAWLKRTENEATIGCYSTRLRWQLKCFGQRWIGVIGNCSYGQKTEGVLIERVSAAKPSDDDNQMIAIVTIAMCGLVVSALIACVGMVLVKRYHSLKKAGLMKRRLESETVNDSCPNYNNGTLPNLLNYETKMDNAKYYELDKTIIDAKIMVDGV